MDSLLVPVGEADVDVTQGAIRLSQPLDFDQSPGTSVGGNPALVYNGATASPRPVVQVVVTTAANEPVPASIQLQLGWDGGAFQAPMTFTPPAGSVPGASYLVQGLGFKGHSGFAPQTLNVPVPWAR